MHLKYPSSQVRSKIDPLLNQISRQADRLPGVLILIILGWGSSLLVDDGGWGNRASSPDLFGDNVHVVWAAGTDPSVVAPEVVEGILTQVAKLWAAGGQTKDEFGFSTAIDGDTLVVGAKEADGVGYPLLNSGAAFVYQRNDVNLNQWDQVAKLTSADLQKDDDFGYSVAISTDIIVVGARLEDGGPGDPLPASGAVYIFERNFGGTDNWGQAAKLTPDDVDPSDVFGQSVSISGDTLVVGSFLEDGGAGNPLLDSGAVYIFERNQGGPGNWGAVKKLAASDAQPGDNFGSSVAIHGDTIVVGAQWEDGGAGDPQDRAGAAYVFERNEGGPDQWGETARLSAAVPDEDDYFGSAVSLFGDVIAVGAYQYDGGPGNPKEESGGVYLFGRDTGGIGQWGLIKVLAPGDVDPGEHFGESLAISEHFVVAGSTEQLGISPYPIYNAGAVYLFEKDAGGTDNWGQTRKFIEGDPHINNLFGDSVAVSGHSLLVGTRRGEAGQPPGEVTDTGTAYLFEPRLLHHVPIAERCSHLFYDDFGNPASGWPNVDTGSTLFQYLNGEYRLLLKNPSWFAAANPGRIFTNYLVQASVRNVTALNGSYGLMFGHQAGFGGFYTFEIQRDGTYTLWRINSDSGVWILLETSFSAAVKPGAASNHLAVVRNGENIRAFINGVKVVDRDDDDHLGTLGVGVTATSFNAANLDLRFDNFTVLPVGCGLSSDMLQTPSTAPGPDHPLQETGGSIFEGPGER